MNSGLVPPTSKTFYFIGMTTAKSSIMKVFPAWAEYLHLDATIAGIDCLWHDSESRYRSVIQFIKDTPNALGALVTSHKLDIVTAAGDLFDNFGKHAEMLGEVSSISKRGGKLWGHAKDPIASGLALTAALNSDRDLSKRTLCLLGAGGSSLALSVYCIELEKHLQPQRIVVTNRSPERLETMKTVHDLRNPDFDVEYHHCPHAECNTQIVQTLPEGSVIANATGLGKDAPGSPLSPNATFPKGACVWDFNYRGDLVFLGQARAQEQSRNLAIVDGWDYFIHGWTRVIAEVFHIDIPTEGPVFDEISALAAANR